MSSNRYLPLTETTYFILIALTEPGHGYYIMQKVEDLSDGRVRIAAGTMYGAIENLLKQKLIQAIPSDDPRRKVYQITNVGKDVLQQEATRLRALIHIADIHNL